MEDVDVLVDVELLVLEVDVVVAAPAEGVNSILANPVAIWAVTNLS